MLLGMEALPSAGFGAQRSPQHSELWTTCSIWISTRKIKPWKCALLRAASEVLLQKGILDR